MAYMRGDYLTEIREMAFLTEDEVAEKLGTTPERVAKIESDGISGLENIAEYATALGASLEMNVRLGDRSWKVPCDLGWLRTEGSR